MKDDGVKYFRGLARECTTRRSRSDKGFDDGKEVQGEFVFIRSESVLAPTDPGSK